MLFRFSFEKFVGESRVYDEEFESLSAALDFIKWQFEHWLNLKAVTLHRHLDRNSCGTIEFVGTYICDRNRVINIQSKVAI